MKKFAEELQSLLNTHNCESTSNTPDVVLARYLLGCLMSFDLAVQQRDTMCGRDPRPSALRRDGAVHETVPNGQLREALAAYAHEAWSGWMEYLFSKCEVGALVLENGALIPAESAQRWLRQMKTPYDELPEKEKESDREQADKILETMRRAAFIDGEWPEQAILLSWMRKHDRNIIFSKRMELLDRLTLLRLSNGGQPPKWRLPDWDGLRAKVAVIVRESSWDDESGNVDGVVNDIVTAVEELLR